MLRGLLVLLVNLFAMPPLAFTGLVGVLLWPRSEMVNRVARVWGRLCLAAAGARVTATGLERMRAARPGVVVANHTSALDIYLCASFVPTPYRMVAKKQLFRIPIFGWALSASGYVPLERTGTRKDYARLAQLPWDRERRALICFFPEGTRSPDNRLHRFKSGAFVTAIREQVPVVPVAIIGAHRVIPARRLSACAGPVEFRVLEPHATTGLTLADAERLRNEIHDQIMAALPPDQQPAGQSPA